MSVRTRVTHHTRRLTRHTAVRKRERTRTRARTSHHSPRHGRRPLHSRRVLHGHGRSLPRKLSGRTRHRAVRHPRKPSLLTVRSGRWRVSLRPVPVALHPPRRALRSPRRVQLSLNAKTSPSSLETPTQPRSSRASTLAPSDRRFGCLRAGDLSRAKMSGSARVSRPGFAVFGRVSRSRCVRCVARACTRSRTASRSSPGVGRRRRVPSRAAVADATRGKTTSVLFLVCEPWTSYSR